MLTFRLCVGILLEEFFWDTYICITFSSEIYIYIYNIRPEVEFS